MQLDRLPTASGRASSREICTEGKERNVAQGNALSPNPALKKGPEYQRASVERKVPFYEKRQTWNSSLTFAFIFGVELFHDPTCSEWQPCDVLILKLVKDIRLDS